MARTATMILLSALTKLTMTTIQAQTDESDAPCGGSTRMCPDGQLVNRPNKNNECEFDTCPTEEAPNAVGEGEACGFGRGVGKACKKGLLCKSNCVAGEACSRMVDTSCKAIDGLLSSDKTDLQSLDETDSSSTDESDLSILDVSSFKNDESNAPATSWITMAIMTCFSIAALANI